MLYTRGDDVSRIGVEALQNLSRSMGFRLVLRPVSSAQDIDPSAIQLFSEADAIYTGIDHLLLENMDGLTQASRETRKPLFGGESGSVEKGAVLAVTINMTEFGDITAEMAVEVLRGRAPGDIPVRTVSNGGLLVNAAAARRFGLDVERLRAGGAHIIDVAP
jgi:putative ABC transport system substrate-binding protein